MPIYEYQCTECGVRFERIQKFSDEPVKVCPECEGLVHRLIQPAGIIFKGSGFYVNDSKGSRKNLTTGSRRDASDDASSTSETEAKDDAGSKSSKKKGTNGSGGDD